MLRGVRTILKTLVPWMVSTFGARVVQAQDARSIVPPLVRITGVVFDSTAGRPLDGALVQLLLASDRTRARTVVADSLGRFSFVDVEAGTWMLGFLHPRTDTLPAGAPTSLLSLQAGEERREVVLFVPSEQGSASPLRSMREPVGRVRGFVIDSAGRPVANARVLVSSGREIARTSERGGFTVEDLPTGDQNLEVRAVGYRPQRFRLMITPGETLLVDVELDRFTPMMATMTASAQRTVAGFEERRGQGRGQFLAAAEIASLRPSQVADALRRMHGVRVSPRASFSSQIRMRTPTRKVCEPTVYLDGVELLTKSNDLDAFVDVDDIAALEVYAKAEEVPLDFPGDPLCGAILIWRKHDRQGNEGTPV